jgi:DNA-binding CsgD family transcriptional regulator
MAYAFTIGRNGPLPWVTPRSLTGDLASELPGLLLNPPQHEVNVQKAMQDATIAYHRATGQRSGLSFVASVPELRRLGPIYLQAIESFGFRDVVTLVAGDPTPEGCVVALPARSELAQTAAVRARWQRVASHVAAGFRLHRKISETVARERAEAAEAVLTVSGKVEHATAEARKPSTREAFRAAVIALERARGPLRRRDPDAAIDLWRGLVQGRWSLVDRFERDGRRYIVAHRNDPAALDPRSLTDRERQVVGYVALGHSNKLIAYELGLSPSTVGVLLARAAAKLGARSRAELVTMVPAHREGGEH